jgi:dienelactone hydrolase
MRLPILVTVISCSLASGARADGPSDNLADNVRRVPPTGIKISEADRAELAAGAGELGKEIETLRAELTSKRALLDLLPDVQIYQKAVDWALRYDEFYKSNEVQIARALLQQGMERVRALRAGSAPWNNATGLVARGYLSKIDGSVQPYGLVVPASYQTAGPQKFRLDFWFHGRGETLTELDFINGRQKSAGEFTPANTFVLHLYGRYCNANKFAGETDLFEALDEVRKHYPIDEDRLVVRGFSMGGAACWQFATHYAGLWAAAAPGAGFSETADFLKVFQNEPVKPTWFEKKLWHLYDCTDYAVNLFNCPTVAYSGEIDRQKQAADLMSRALKEEGIELTHLIGPKTAHAYERGAREEINRRIDSIAARPRDPVPDKIKFTTWTLRYNQMLWVTVDGLEEHWERARVEAEMDKAGNVLKVNTKNVSAMTFSFPPGRVPLDNTRRPTLILDGQKTEAPPVMSDRSWTGHFRKHGRKWSAAEADESGALMKRHGLQGPIDDAFMDSFIMVKPTGEPMNEKIGRWTELEMNHAIDHWRRQFRGEARVKNDTDVTDEDIASNHLVLWGDPSGNKMLARLSSRLPIRWDAQGVHTPQGNYPADRYVPVLIWPNPLNPKRYLVLNSGFTFREYDYLNNARQVPKLPDWAIVDMTVPASSRAPGGIANAGFFGEQWEFKPPTKLVTQQ